MLAGGVLELEHHQGQAVDEQHHVGPAVDLALDHGELVDGQVVVVLGVVEVDDAHLGAANLAVGRAVLDGDAVDQVPMRGAVAGDEVGAFGAEQALEGVLDGRCREVRVEARERGAEPGVEGGLGELGAFGARARRARSSRRTRWSSPTPQATRARLPQLQTQRCPRHLPNLVGTKDPSRAAQTVVK